MTTRSGKVKVGADSTAAAEKRSEKLPAKVKGTSKRKNPSGTSQQSKKGFKSGQANYQNKTKNHKDVDSTQLLNIVIFDRGVTGRQL
jgi:hypothetical protein